MWLRWVPLTQGLKGQPGEKVSQLLAAHSILTVFLWVSPNSLVTVMAVAASFGLSPPWAARSSPAVRVYLPNSFQATQPPKTVFLVCDDLLTA